MTTGDDIYGFFGFVAAEEGFIAVLPIPAPAVAEAAGALAGAASKRAAERGGGEDMAVDILIGNALLAARRGGATTVRDLTVCAAAVATLTGLHYFTMAARGAGEAIDAELIRHGAGDHAAGLTAVRREVARRAGLRIGQVPLGVLHGPD